VALILLGVDNATRGYSPATRWRRFNSAREKKIAQPRQNPPLSNLHRDLLLPCPSDAWPRCTNGLAVVSRHLGVGPIDARIVAIGVDDGGSEIVANDRFWCAAQEAEQIDLDLDPIGQPLARARPV
jgi:hypothetical protein